jgi:hypothetical protein
MRSMEPSVRKNSRVSSVFDPTSGSMSAGAPARMESIGCSGIVSPSTAGAHGR